MGTLYDDENYVSVIETKLTESNGIDALREGWLKLFGSFPTNEALAILTAQSALETGRWNKINNFNFGNLKMARGSQFTLFATGENIWNKEKRKNEWHWFEPPHYQTAFRSYNSEVDGASDYIEFLSDRKSSEKWRNEAYKVAFKLLKRGKPKGYSYALYKAGYYTGNPETYTAGVIKLYNEFLEKIKLYYPNIIIIDEIRIIGNAEVVNESVPDHLREEPLAVEDQYFPEEKSKNIGKESVAMLIAAGLATVYAWVTGLF